MLRSSILRFVLRTLHLFQSKLIRRVSGTPTNNTSLGITQYYLLRVGNRRLRIPDFFAVEHGKSLDTRHALKVMSLTHKRRVFTVKRSRNHSGSDGKNPAMTMRSRRTLWYNSRCSLLPFRFQVVCLGQ